ncbi:MAG: hypothetical protein MJ082_04735, partial [Clostridia bacterium]|nr:hypothetical protein [Clostridia bacterium]
MKKTPLLAFLLAFVLLFLPISGMVATAEGTSSDATILLRRDFEDGTYGTSTLRTANASIITEEDGNKYLRAVTSSSNDFYYQIHAIEAGAGNYATDSSTSTSPDYFNTQSIILMVSLSCGDSPISFFVQSKHPGKSASTAYLTGRANGVVTTKGGQKLCTLQKGTWTAVAIEINFSTGKIYYYVDGTKTYTENLGASDKRISYFNFGITKFEPEAGAELRVDNLIVGFGTLTEDYFKTPVTFRVGKTTEVKKYSGTQITVPEIDGVKMYMATMGSVQK